MAERKGRSTEEAPGKEERKKERPECSTYLRALIDAFVSGLLTNCQVCTTLTEARKSARSSVEFVLSIPNADVNLVRGHLWLYGKEKGLDDFTPETARDKKRRWLDVLQEELIGLSLEDAKRICNDFDINVTDEQAREIMTTAWDRRGIEAYSGLQELIEGKDREYLRRAERHYNSLLTKLVNSPHLPCHHWATVETAVVLGVLDVLRTENKKVDERKKREGFTQPGGGPTRQAFWGDIIVGLVDMVNPLCRWRKGEWYKKGKSSPQVRNRALKFVARLLHTCYPAVWSDDYKLVGKRYRDSKGRQQT